MSDLTGEQLEEILTGDPLALDVHLHLVEKDVVIDGQKFALHCHCLVTDANGKIRTTRLVEFMRNVAADYAIPRMRVEEARIRDAAHKSTEAIAAIHNEARALFTDLEKTGEGGELLLFLLAERFLKLPQVLCKMHLKTDAALHYNGADGIFATVTSDGLLKLFWGESKIYKNVTAAIRDCLASLGPYLKEKDGEKSSRERDLMLLSDKADLGNPELSSAFKRYFDMSSPQSNRVQYCGIAMVGFDVDYYPEEGATGVLEDIVKSTKANFTTWTDALKSRSQAEKLEHFDIHFLFVPMPSVEQFRAEFLEAMGKS